jgi:23S rRNA-/tRNA-specific pseudouridylate synthase
VDSALIFFEDEHLLVLNKPAMLHSVALPNGGGPSLAALLCEYLPGIENVSRKPEDGGLVQRLDFETSGAIIAAKTKIIWEKLFEALKAGEIEKSYLAVLEGKFSGQKELHTFIGSRSRRGDRVRVFEEEPRAKMRAQRAHSIFSAKNYLSKINATLVKISAPSAHRHQVRAHAGFLGHPLVGDEIYGSTRTLIQLFASFEATPAELPTFLLHAALISFTHPATKEKITFDVPLPLALG